MAVSAAGPAAPVVPGLPVAAAHADEAGGGRGARVTGLAVDGREDGPLDLDDPAPRLSRRVGGAAAGWTQAACRIRAARTENDLDHRPRPDRPGPARRRPRRRPVGRPPPGGHPPELRLLHGAHHRQPRGLTTVPEQWDMGNSKNHMILLQIEEWFHSGLVGIRQARGKAGWRELVIDPRPVGDLTHAEGDYRTPYGVVSVR